MLYFKQPKNFEIPLNSCCVIGYFKDRVIVKSEEGALYFVEGDENAFPVGTFVESKGLFSIDEISNVFEKREILNLFS